MERMKIIKDFCQKCNQVKNVFSTDRYGRKICIECGTVLTIKEIEF